MTFTRYFFALMLLIIPASISAQSFAGGAGSDTNPWLVATPAQLNDIRNFPNNHFRQTADIDLSGYAAGEGWEPIGTETAPFHGSFDGNGFKISGLRINRPTEDFVGLFGVIARLNFSHAAKLENVVIEDAFVSGRFDTGGLVGFVTNNGQSTGAQPVINYSSFKGHVRGDGNQTGGLAGRVWGGSINYSRALAIVVSTGVRVGGLVGMNGDISNNFAPGFIWNSYAKGYAEGDQIVGGLVGVQGFGKVLESYASVVVKGDQFVGGLVGAINFNSFASNTPEFRNNYWNGAFSGVSNAVVSTQYPNIATSLTSEEFRDPANFAAFNPSNSAGFDFDTKWAAGTSRAPRMPYLRAFTNTADNISGETGFLFGSGSAADPYQIVSLAGLDVMRYFPFGNYRLEINLDINDFNTAPAWLPSKAFGWDDDLGMMPIGTADTPFRGNFDGNGREILNLYINRDTVAYGGLFGVVVGNADTTVTIKNLGLPNANVRARGEDTASDLGGVGVLAGKLGGYTTVEDIWVTGKVNPQRTVCGGLAGIAQGNIRRVSVHAEVSCPSSAGVLAGRLGVLPLESLPFPDVEDVAVSGSVNAGLRVGGLTGEAYRLNMARVVGASNISGSFDTPGALYPQRGTGAAVPVSVTGTFWNADISGTDQHDNGTPGAHGIGLTGNTAFQQSSYTGFDFATVWDIHEDHAMPFLRNNARTKTGRIVYTGAEGMRMLASPIEGATYADILAGRWTQGATGGSVSFGAPNVFSWSNTGTGAWTSVTDLDQTAGAFLAGIFENEAITDATASTAFPKTSFLSGRERTGGAVALNPADNGFTLVANPYFSAISWLNITKSGFHPVVYVWDINEGWLSFNGVSGSLTNGIIAPFQSFLVATMPGQSPSMNITTNARTTGGTFRGRELPSEDIFFSLEFWDENNTRRNATWLHFHENGLDGRDNWDALRLEPLSTDITEVYTLSRDGLALDIQSLPVNANAFEIPVMVRTPVGTGTIDSPAITGHLQPGSYTLPEGWLAELVDDNSGEIYILSEQTRIPVVLSPENTMQFTLRVQRSQTTSLETVEVPVQTGLTQNWPNPFNPTTTIGYTIGSDVAGAGPVPVEITVYDLTGRQVALLFSGAMSAGTYTVPFNGASLSSGMYIYRLQAGNYTDTRRMTLIK